MGGAQTVLLSDYIMLLVAIKGCCGGNRRQCHDPCHYWQLPRCLKPVTTPHNNCRHLPSI